MSFQVSNRGWLRPKTEEKQPKEKKVKQPKEKKVKEPKPEPEPEPELTPEEYIQTIIDEKNKLIEQKLLEITDIQNIMNSLKLKCNDEIIINERRAIISKVISKLPRKEKDKSEKEELYNNLSKDIKKFDSHFNITNDKLSNCDLKF